MSSMNELDEGLGYVRHLTRRSERGLSPSSIYLLWAVISLAGFSMVDFAPERVGLFWTLAGPLGGVASGILGWRHSVRHGQLSRDLGTRHMLHWAGMMVVIFLAVPLGVTGAVAWQELYKFIILVLALGYFLAGVHLDRAMIWISLLVIAGYLGLFFIPAYGWTVVGLLLAVGLAATSFLGGRSGAAAGE